MRTPNNEGLSSDIVDGACAGGNASGPERRCVLSGESRPAAQMVRLALAPDGAVLPDIRARAPGRGAWICANAIEVEQACANGHLGKVLKRAFKGAAVAVPRDLGAQIERGLMRQVLDRFGLEMRAGNVVLGSERIADSARTGSLALLCHASDASAGGKSKLDQAWRVGTGREGSGEQARCLPLDRQALSVALGRDNVVHVGLSDAKAAERVSLVLDRYESFAQRKASGEDHPVDEANAWTNAASSGGANSGAAANVISVEG